MSGRVRGNGRSQWKPGAPWCLLTNALCNVVAAVVPLPSALETAAKDLVMFSPQEQGWDDALYSISQQKCLWRQGGTLNCFLLLCGLFPPQEKHRSLCQGLCPEESTVGGLYISEVLKNCNSTLVRFF